MPAVLCLAISLWTSLKARASKHSIAASTFIFRAFAPPSRTIQSIRNELSPFGGQVTFSLELRIHEAHIGETSLSAHLCSAAVQSDRILHVRGSHVALLARRDPARRLRRNGCGVCRTGNSSGR